MAEGRVELSQIIQEDIFKDTRDSAAATIAVVKELKDSLSSIASSTKNGLRENGLQTKEDIEKLAVALQKIKELTEANNKLKSVEAEANQLLAKSYNDLTEAEKEQLIIQAQNKEVRRETQRLIKQEAIAIKDITDSYKKLSNEYDIAQRKAKNLGAQLGVNSAEFKKAALDANNLRSKIEAIDQGLGQFHRNVGNYKSGYDGLAASINQLTREAPSAAVSMNTFFLAISNNLPMLTDEIGKIKKANIELEATGKPTVSVIGKIASAFFSWQTAISLGITLLTVYGGEAIDFIFGTKKMSEAEKEFNDYLSKSNDTIKSLNDETDKLIDKRKVANGEISKQQLDEKEINQKFLDAKNKANEGYFTELDKLKKKFGETDSEQGILEGIQVFGTSNEFRKQFKVLYDQKTREILAAENRRIEQLATLVDDGNKAFSNRVKDRDKLAAEHQKKVDDEAEKERKDTLNRTYKLQEEEFDRETEAMLEAAKRSNEVLEARLKEQQRILDEADKLNYDLAKIAAQSQLNKEKALEDEKLKQKEIAKKQELAILGELQKGYDNFFNRKVRLIDYDLNKSQAHQTDLALLAQKGVENASDNYAFEQKKQAELEEQKLKLERQKERTALAIGVYRAYATNGGDLKKTLTDATALAALAGTLPVYYKGTENTGEGGNLDDKGGFTAILHPNERVLTKDQNARIGDISNDELANVAQRARLMSPSYAHTITDVEFKKIGNKLDKVVDAIEKIEIPREKYNWNAKQKALIHVVETRNKITKTHHKVGGIW